MIVDTDVLVWYIRGDTLLTANAAHYRMIPELALRVFRPGSS